MNRKTPEAKLNIPMCLACILFCLTLFSLHLTGGLYAKYTAKAKGEDAVRVAVMAMDATLVIDEDIYIAPGETQDFEIILTNKEGDRICEVVQNYTLSVKNLTENMKLNFEYYAVDGENATKVVEASGVFPAGIETSENYRVRVTWPDAPQPANQAFEVDALQLIVNAEQID